MDVQKVKVSSTTSVMEVVEVIDRAASGAALVVDEGDRLLGVLTDGDIRRALLQHFDFERACGELLRTQAREFGPTPLSLPAGASHEEMAAFVRFHSIRHLPLLDPSGRVTALITRDELIGATSNLTRGVLMAGGFGRRMRPLTDLTPKPMLDLNGKPVLERLIDEYKRHGITRITLVVHYRKEVIQEYFGNGRDFGVDIDYIVEAEPRGTAGSLSELPIDEGLLLVCNADIVSSVNFRQMEIFHCQNNASITVAIVRYDTVIPYGVVEMEEPNILGIVEKPRSRNFVNAGMYFLSPQSRRFIPNRGVYNMTDLISDALRADDPVLGFPVREYWRDIGRPDDYEKARIETRIRL